jgi:hypothetical protein
VTLVDRVLAEAWRRDSWLHGEAHWLAVATTGLDPAAETGADPQIVFAFGLLHDTRRENDSRDPGHGPRAAVFARELHRDGDLLLEDGRLSASPKNFPQRPPMPMFRHWRYVAYWVMRMPGGRSR